jgi:putative oxidoreductase
MRRLAIFLGRFFIGSLFIFSGLSKLFDWQKAERDFASVLGDWHSLSFHSIQGIFSSLLPLASVILTVVCVIEILGGVFLILGIKARFFAFLLLLLFLPITFLLHPFWFFDGSKAEIQLTLFMKNIAILGGLFYVLTFGAKEEAVDVEFENL